MTRIVRRPNGTSETEIVLPDEATGHRGYRIHPVLLDAALQGLAAALSSESLADSNEATYLPVSFERIRVFGEVGVAPGAARNWSARTAEIPGHPASWAAS